MLKDIYISIFSIFIILMSSSVLAIEESDFQAKFIEDIRLKAQSMNESQNIPIISGRVLSAFKQVPRRVFIPTKFQDKSYYMVKIPFGSNQSMNEPYIAALMTEALNIKPEHKVLEIGTGTGYHTAVMSRLSHFVYSVEINGETANMASNRLRQLGYENTLVQFGDGMYGWEEYAPYDRILLTAAVSELPKPLINQLKIGGYIVAAIGNPNFSQMLTVFKKNRAGKLLKKSILPVRLEFLQS